MGKLTLLFGFKFVRLHFLGPLSKDAYWLTLLLFFCITIFYQSAYVVLLGHQSMLAGPSKFAEKFS